jgi:predicted DNA-binding protein
MSYTFDYRSDYMATLSLRLPDSLLHDVDRGAQAMGVPRAVYVRIALEHLKEELEAKHLRDRIQKASLLVRAESMSINAEFSSIEADPDA